jgi:hypothetical protein
MIPSLIAAALMVGGPHKPVMEEEVVVFTAGHIVEQERRYEAEALQRRELRRLEADLQSERERRLRAESVQSNVTYGSLGVILVMTALIGLMYRELKRMWRANDSLTAELAAADAEKRRREQDGGQPAEATLPPT